MHDDSAVLHELVPLHELTPLHFTASSARAAVVAPAANKAAAEAATSANLPMSTPMTPTIVEDAPTRRKREVTERAGAVIR